LLKSIATISPRRAGKPWASNSGFSREARSCHGRSSFDRPSCLPSARFDDPDPLCAEPDPLFEVPPSSDPRPDDPDPELLPEDPDPELLPEDPDPELLPEDPESSLPEPDPLSVSPDPEFELAPQLSDPDPDPEESHPPDPLRPLSKLPPVKSSPPPPPLPLPLPLEPLPPLLPLSSPPPWPGPPCAATAVVLLTVMAAHASNAPVIPASILDVIVGFMTLIVPDWRAPEHLRDRFEAMPFRDAWQLSA
jgi:hypothetical protein